MLARLITLAACLAAAAFAATFSVAAAQPANGPVAHAAATCADFTNQQAAQNAANTRDPDGDGIYCEHNPCPCSAAWHAQHGGSGGAGSPAPRRRSHAPLGRSILLGRVTRRGGCQVLRGLPDRACTPGAYYEKATKARICRPGYASAVRNVSESAKDAVYTEYRMSRHFNGRTGEVDHVVSLELGGSNVRANLFPEAASPRPGSHEKDRLENRLHDEVCSGRISVRHAQRLIATNWVAAYHARFG